ncbi:hypothetical protein HHK36_005275 [Tetracentron sinense]|uniref:Phytocyanin domain-containing protein n=1 Tax=Tetracentron sinense TaxID=13715 RepID=A0A835DMN4_TETSI|nr:hypothetical protein HHK36_005275 [Tetracentron sinense]
MEFRRSLSFLFVILMGLFCSSQSYMFYVGSSEGWVLNPSENFNHWAERNRFRVNDTLLFKYKKGSDSVLVVSKEDCNKCNTEKPIMSMVDGDSVFKFDRSGPFFFISGTYGSCEKGQKLIVVVLGLTAVKHRSPEISAPHMSPSSPSPITKPPASSPPKGLTPMSASPMTKPPVSSPTTVSPSPYMTPVSPFPKSETPVSSPTTAEAPSPSPSSSSSSAFTSLVANLLAVASFVIDCSFFRISEIIWAVVTSEHWNSSALIPAPMAR